jgi:hypothetical protein
VIVRAPAKRRLVLALALAAIQPLHAQSIGDAGARAAPQVHSYTIGAPSSTTVRELSVPLFVLVPLSRALTVDLGTSYARAHVEQTTSGKTETSDIAGLTDTQVRATYIIGDDFVVLTGGVNLPTGQSRVTPEQQPAAGLIGSDFLAFPISSMGAGFGGTGGVAIAHPFGGWNVGGGFSIRRTAQYDPFDTGGGPSLHYQPGNEYRARLGADRTIGSARAMVGFSYSTFGNDDLAGSIYNTGNRYLSQLSFDDAAGPGRITIAAWNLFRDAGTMLDSIAIGRENIANAALSYDVPAGNTLLEPNIEGRVWSQSQAATSLLATVGVRAQLSVGGLTILPGVGLTTGRVASQDAGGVNEMASLSGWHATLAVRLR